MKHFAGPMIALFFLTFWMQIWAAFAPVTLFMTATPVELSKSSLTARVSGYKIRDCAVIGNSFVGWAYADNQWREVPFSFPKDTSPNSSKPRGYERQSFGLWRWDTPPNTTRVRMTVQHSCDGDLKVSVLGPFEVAPPAN